MFEFVTEKTVPEYEAFIKTHENGHFMQSYKWARVKDNWKWEAVIVRGADGGITGSLSALIRKIPGLPYTIMYAGRAPVCDYRDGEMLHKLTEGAKAIAKKHRAYVLTMDPDVLSSDIEFTDKLKALGYTLKTESKNFEGIQPRYVFRLDIAGKTEDEVFENFQSKTRYNIRLASKKGVTSRIVSDDMVGAFSKIMLETGVRDGFVVRSASYFTKLLREMGEHARLYMAFYEGEPVAGTLAVCYGDKVWYLYGASSNEHRNVMPNYLLQWDMIRWAVERKCRIYDFRGVSGDLSEDNPLYGLYRFKKGFSGDFCEFCGEFNYVFKPFAFSLIEKGSRLFRSARKRVFLLKNRGRK